MRVQIGIRDSWDKEGAPIQQALSKLKEALGVDVVVAAQWQLLLTELDSYYPDKSTFVPTIASCVQSLLIGFAALTEGEETAKWADELLDHVGRSLKVFLEVGVNPIALKLEKP